MAIPSTRKDLARLFWRRAGLLALLAAVIAVASGVWGVFRKERDSRELRMIAERQAQELSTRGEELEEDIGKLQTNRGKEEALREQYAVGQRGEGLIVLVDSKPVAPVQATSTFRTWVRKFLPFW